LEYLNGISIDFVEYDVEEPLADPDTVIAYKAAQVGEGVIVEDTIFEVDGFDYGVDVKFKKDDLLTLYERTGMDIPARLESRIGVLIEGKVYIYIGILHGYVTKPFNDHSQVIRRVFKIEGDFDQRKKACHNFLSNTPYKITEPIFEWNGDFQK
jgi:hypothetical protein